MRLVWNAMASSKSIMAKAGIPQALHYTILDENEGAFIKDSPLQCPRCQAYLNPYSKVSLDKQHYICCICKANNPLPQRYLQDRQ